MGLELPPKLTQNPFFFLNTRGQEGCVFYTIALTPCAFGQGIIAQCYLNSLDPHVESDRQKAACSIADMADSLVGEIGRFQWDIAVTRIGQLASEMRLSTGGQSVGGSNGNADELTNWNGTKKRGLGI